MPMLFISRSSPDMIPPGTAISYLNHIKWFRDSRDAWKHPARDGYLDIRRLT
jgi:hypothetical protein